MLSLQRARDATQEWMLFAACSAKQLESRRKTTRGFVSTEQQTDVADLPISQAAYEVLEIERGAPLDGDFDVDLGATFTDAQVRGSFARRPTIGPVRNYRLRDVLLDASTSLLVRGRRRIPETRYLIDDGSYADMLTKPLYPTPVEPDGHYIIGCNRAWHNYYHWLIQGIPAIYSGLRHAEDRKITVILPPDVQAWQDESLALLGVQDIPRLVLDISTHYLLPSAEFSEFLGDRLPGQVTMARAAAYQRMSQSVPRTGPVAEEIYVARTDSQNRIAANEAELIERLERQHVRIIVPGTLSVSEQIEAFRSARLVIGPHGAGMSNIVFCRSGSFVYEMLPRHYPHSAFNRVAQSGGLNYWADLFDGVDSGTGFERQWQIDLDVVAARLDAIREKLAATPRVESAMDFLRRTQGMPAAEAVPVSPPLPPSPPPVGRLRRWLQVLWPWRPRG